MSLNPVFTLDILSIFSLSAAHQRRRALFFLLLPPPPLSSHLLLSDCIALRLLFCRTPLASRILLSSLLFSYSTHPLPPTFILGLSTYNSPYPTPHCTSLSLSLPPSAPPLPISIPHHLHHPRNPPPPPSLNIVPLKRSCVVSSRNTARQKSVISHLSAGDRRRR